jgi:hypothetical protein
MSRYKKRPLVVDAIRWTDKNLPEVLDFCGNVEVTYTKEVIVYCMDGHHVYDEKLKIDDGHKYTRAEKGDYIIKDTDGSFYSLKPKDFEKSILILIMRVEFIF